MRSSAILLVGVVAIAHSLTAAPATVSERSEKLVASSTKHIESKTWEYGLTPQVIGQYALNNGLSSWGKGCADGFGYGCTPYGYSPACFVDDCACIPGGYNEALNGLNSTFRALFLKRAELKSPVDHKENENQVKKFMMIEYFELSSSLETDIARGASPPKVSFLECNFPE